MAGNAGREFLALGPSAEVALYGAQIRTMVSSQPYTVIGYNGVPVHFAAIVATAVLVVGSMCWQSSISNRVILLRIMANRCKRTANVGKLI